jgi:hypothetical protein
VWAALVAMHQLLHTTEPWHVLMLVLNLGLPDGK